MAVERLALGTQETDALARARIHDAGEPGGKFRPRSHSLVVGNPVAIKLRIARAAAERVAQRDIGDALAGEPLCQCLAREPRAPARERDRAHVGNCGDAGARQQSHEALGWKVRVADGQEIVRHCCNVIRRSLHASSAARPSKNSQTRTSCDKRQHQISCNMPDSL